METGSANIICYTDFKRMKEWWLIPFPNMNIIQKKVYNKRLDRAFDEQFTIGEEGLYAIEIRASARSWWQNTLAGRSFLRKDSLTVLFDGKPIISAPEKKRLYANDFWNGNILKGNDAVLYAVFKLSKGLTTISFVIHGQPFLETVILHTLSKNLIELANISSSKCDRSPWITCVTSKKVILRSISITAYAQKSANDDDDLQLRINGEKIKNQNPLSHRDWYWCGKVLRGQNVEYKKEFREQKNYVIELWADNTPSIRRLTYVFEKNPSDKSVPTVDKPRWTGDFHEDSDQIILARAIFGEGRNLPEIGRVAIGWVIRNRVEDARWGNTYHDVILQKLQFSAFNIHDPNRHIVENPTENQSEQKAWHESYVIAGNIIQGTIPDPTEGANHYYSTFIRPPKWTRAQGAALTLRVENTLFYLVPASGKRMILPALCIALLCAIISYVVIISTRVEAYNMSVEKSKHFHERVADNSIAIYYGCGTECEGIRVFNERTGKKIAEFNYGIGYQWDPDKRRAVAFHTSPEQGLTIGDKNGNELFTYMQSEHERSTDELPRFVSWAPDGSRLAIIYNNGGNDINELLIFDTRSPIFLLTKNRIPTAQSHSFYWDMRNQFISINDIIYPL